MHSRLDRLRWRAHISTFSFKLALRETRAFLRSRKDLAIKEVVEGDRISAPLEKACVFVNFDAHGIVDRHVLHHLGALRTEGYEIIFVCNSPSLADAEIAKLRTFCREIVLRDNRGYDFGAWKAGISRLDDLAHLDHLIIANDSVYGPLRPLGPMIAAMRSRGYDFWGITESIEVRPHLQSYFICFEASVLRSSVFRRFWDNFPLYSEKFRVIFAGEIGLSTRLRRAGFRMGALCPYAAIRDHDPVAHDAMCSFHPMGISNPTRYFWDVLVRDLGSPFLKVDLVRDRLVPAEGAAGWRSVVASGSGYDAALIADHAARVGSESRE